MKQRQTYKNRPANCFKIMFAIIAIFFTTNVYSEDLKLKIGYVNFPPFTFMNDQKEPDGLLIDIARKVYDEMGIQYTEKKYPAGRLFKYLAEGEVDVWYGIKIPSLDDVVATGKEIIGVIEMRIYAIGKEPDIQKKEDLNGKKVILVTGYSYSGWRDYIRNKENNIKSYQTPVHTSALEMLKRGRGEYMLNYKLPVNQALQTMSVKDLKYTTVLKLNVYFQISKKHPNYQQVLDQLDQTYKNLLDSGKIVPL